MLSMSNMAENHFQPAPELQAWLNLLNRIGNDLDTMTREKVPALRAIRELRQEFLLWQIPLESVRDLVVPSAEHPVPVRLYAPPDRQLAREGKLPVVLFFHGGGWTLGNSSLYDPLRARWRSKSQLWCSPSTIDWLLKTLSPLLCAMQTRF